MLNLNEVLKNVKEWVKETGSMQISKIENNLNFSTKSSAADIVTEVDIASEKIIIENIKRNYPTHSILSEEEGFIENEAEYTWVIDPLDGTTNYFHRYPIFSISIALRNFDRVVLGVVYVPKLNEMFYAIEGHGAYLNDKDIHVSQVENIERALMATGFPYDKKTNEINNIDIFNSLIRDIMCIRRSGSAAFDLCSVACGRIDGYWELKINDWDIDAGVLIVKEAGGKVITSRREKRINIIAGNPAITDTLSEYIKNTGNYF